MIDNECRTPLLFMTYRGVDFHVSISKKWQRTFKIRPRFLGDVQVRFKFGTYQKVNLFLIWDQCSKNHICPHANTKPAWNLAFYRLEWLALLMCNLKIDPSSRSCVNMIAKYFKRNIALCKQ